MELPHQVLVVCASLAESLLTAYSTLIALLPPSDNHTAALVAEYERRRHSLISPFVELKVKGPREQLFSGAGPNGL